MIKKNPIRRVHIIGLPIILHNPESIEFGNSIGRPRIKRCRLFLWDLLYFSIELTRGCLIEPNTVFQGTRTNRLQNVQDSRPIRL